MKNTLRFLFYLSLIFCYSLNISAQESELTKTALSFFPSAPGPFAATYSLNGSRLFRAFSTGIFSPDTVRVGNDLGFAYLTSNRLSINTAATIPTNFAYYGIDEIRFKAKGSNQAQEEWIIQRNPIVQDPPQGNFEIVRTKIAAGGGAVLDPVMTVNTDLEVRFHTIGNSLSANDLRVTANGTLTTNASDIRMKENISTLENSLEKIMKLRGVSFTWKNDPAVGPQHGLIAQEVLKVVPDLVFKKGEYYGVDYSEMVGLFVEAIKEQQGIIEQQRLEILELKKLEERISKMEKMKFSSN